MSSATIKKIIPCKKKQLIEMVLDIEKYPEFVPFCYNAKVYEIKDEKEIFKYKYGNYKIVIPIMN